MNYLKRFLREDCGQDLIEYALLGAFISIAAIAVLTTLGPIVAGVFTTIQNALP